MALVINIGTTMNISVIGGDKGSFYLKDSGTMGKDLSDGFLADKEKFTELMDYIYVSHPELKDEDLVISLDYGSGIEYRTVNVPRDSLLDYDKNATEDEIEEYFYDIFRSYQPAGLDQLYDRYAPCLMSSYVGEQEATLSLAFLPQPVLESITDYAEKKKLNLLGIYPFSYGIYNALDDCNKLLIMDLEASYMVFSAYGLVVWFKDGLAKPAEDKILDFLVQEALSYFPMDKDNVRTEEITSISAVYYCEHLNNMSPLGRFTLSAMGCIIPPKQIDSWRSKANNKMKGGADNVTRSLWKLFKKK